MPSDIHARPPKSASRSARADRLIEWGWNTRFWHSSALRCTAAGHQLSRDELTVSGHGCDRRTIALRLLALTRGPPVSPGPIIGSAEGSTPRGPRTSSTDELGASASGGGGNQFSATFSSLRSPGYLRSCRRRRRPCEPLTSAPPTRRCHSRTSMKRQLSQVARTPQFRMRGRAWGGSLTRAAPRLLGAFSGSQFAKRE